MFNLLDLQNYLSTGEGFIFLIRLLKNLKMKPNIFNF